VHRVQEIVNQPVEAIPLRPEDHPALFRPGWFHPGALTPDFEHVDIRATQEVKQYAQWPYVTSDVTPGLMYAGSGVEFNAMTKYFYTDRALPKKRLTEPEMLEINELYRVIGGCLGQIKQRGQSGQAEAVATALPGTGGDPAPAAIPTDASSSWLRHASDPLVLGGTGAILLLALLLVRVSRGSS